MTANRVHYNRYELGWIPPIKFRTATNIRFDLQTYGGRLFTFSTYHYWQLSYRCIIPQQTKVTMKRHCETNGYTGKNLEMTKRKTWVPNAASKHSNIKRKPRQVQHKRVHKEGGEKLDLPTFINRLTVQYLTIGTGHDQPDQTLEHLKRFRCSSVWSGWLWLVFLL